MRRQSRCLGGLVAAAIILLARPGAAQDPGSGTVLASVEDELGGVLVGATVTLVEVPSQTTYDGVTDSKGIVSFEGLARGEYLIRAASPGFKTLERHLTIDRNRARPLKLQLKIDLSESVDVKERKRPAPAREKIDQNADAVAIDDDLLAGVPMSVGSDRVVDFLSHFLSPALGSVSIVMDGQEVSDLTLPPGAIDELHVNKNPYSAEYRRPGRARIEVLSQNGSKSHHHADGSLVFSNSGLSAKGPFMIEKPPLQQWMGDGTFSGPLHRWNGSYLFAGSVFDDQTTGVVNAVTIRGPFRAVLPQQRTEGVGRARLDLGPIDRLKLTLKYDYQSKHEVNGGVGGLVLPELAYDSDTIVHTVRFNAHTILSATSVNDTLVSVERPTEAIGNAASGPMMVVNGAFKGGVDQHFRRDEALRLEFQDIATQFRGSHTLRFGGRLRPLFGTVTDASNFGGTFEFANLDMFAAGRPYVYRVSQGTPTIDYGHHVADGFFQDEVRLRPDFSLMLGARYDFESEIHDYNNIAPRMAFAFAPGQQKTNFRGGFGVFYDRLGESAAEQFWLYDGRRTRTLVMTDPSFPNAFAAGAERIAASSRYTLAPDVSAPYLVQTGVSVEHELWRKTKARSGRVRSGVVAVEYSHTRGVDLLRARDLNAPLPGTTKRPDPTVTELIQLESTGAMTNNSLHVTFGGKSGLFDGSAIDTYSRTYNNTPGSKAAGRVSFTLPVDSYNPAAEWGRADFDIPHRFNLAGVLDLPRDFQIGSVLEISSGKPYEITTGFDNNGDGKATDRPLGVPRNAEQMQGFARLDLRLAKLFRTGRPLKYPASKPGELRLMVDVFNLLNRANYKEYVGVQSSPFFGLPVSAEKGRRIQLATSYRF